jgi:predicted kinase
MPKIAYVMIGVSGSGKSSVIQEIKKGALPGMRVVVFSLDDCRLSFLAERVGTEALPEDVKEFYRVAFDFANANAKDFDAFVDKTWIEALTADIVFIDNTNLTRKSRARWISDARAKKFEIHAIQMVTPLKTVIDRQKSRHNKSVPESVIHDMYARQQEVLLGSEADCLFVVDGTKPPELSLANLIHA